MAGNIFGPVTGFTKGVDAIISGGYCYCGEECGFMADFTSEPLLFCLDNAVTLFTCWRTGLTRLVGAGDLIKPFVLRVLMGVSFITAARSPWRRVEAARVVAGHGFASGAETRVVLDA